MTSDATPHATRTLVRSFFVCASTAHHVLDLLAILFFSMAMFAFQLFGKGELSGVFDKKGKSNICMIGACLVNMGMKDKSLNFSHNQHTENLERCSQGRVRKDTANFTTKRSSSTSSRILIKNPTWTGNN
ncbi:hypothetical protein Hypma_000731 [Hypsizygus marmoreus]|uniref:Uncharacterized protein n=1 Tax=Hypsizygus marmoreus TaxID=39966 RepID=A0A369JEQ0_HYPMA|nr:hypothetical protein Hypma_000731 [Hypsizygus marmoreus]